MLFLVKNLKMTKRKYSGKQISLQRKNLNHFKPSFFYHRTKHFARGDTKKLSKRGDSFGWEDVGANTPKMKVGGQKKDPIMVGICRRFQ